MCIIKLKVRNGVVCRGVEVLYSGSALKRGRSGLHMGLKYVVEGLEYFVEELKYFV